jgi:hypothetical protein
MRGRAIAISLGLALCSHLAAAPDAVCSPSDEAPESLPVLSAAGKSSTVLDQIPRDTASIVKLDAVSLGAGGDWLKIRSAATTGWVSGKYLACRLSPEQAGQVIGAEADQVMRALAARDMQLLASFVHPVKGLRFSADASIDEKGIVLSATQIKTALSDPMKRVWGYDDASGSPIRLTFAQYYRAFVYDLDFARAPERGFNSFTGETTTQNTIWELYPSAIAVEYHIPGDHAADGKWASLRLVFEQQSGQWRLTAIVHDAWTI